LFNLISSRRFKEAEDPREDNNHYWFKIFISPIACS
jgi:hypothetical protein